MDNIRYTPSDIPRLNAVIGTFADNASVYDPKTPALGTLDPDYLLSEVNGSHMLRSPLSHEELRLIIDLLVCTESVKGGYHRIHDGKRESDKCLGCVLDHRCVVQDTLQTLTDPSDVEHALQEQFGHEIAVSSVPYIDYLLESTVTTPEEFEQWKEVLKALTIRLREMPESPFISMMMNEFQAFGKILEVRMGIYQFPQSENSDANITEADNELLYFIYSNTVTGIEELLRSVGMNPNLRKQLTIRWRSEGKEIKTSGARRTFAYGQLFRAYVDYLQPGNTIATVVESLNLSMDTAYKLLADFGLPTKAKQFRSEILEVPSDEEYLMALLNEYWNSDMTLNDIAEHPESPYKMKTLNEIFIKLIERFKSRMNITGEDYEQFRQEYRIISRRPILSIKDLITAWNRAAHGESKRKIEVELLLRPKTLNQNFVRLGLEDFFRKSTTEAHGRFLLLRNSTEYALVNDNGKMSQLTKLDYRIVQKIQQGVHSWRDIHRSVWPFHWISGYQYEDFERYMQGDFRSKVSKVGFEVPADK